MKYLLFLFLLSLASFQVNAVNLTYETAKIDVPVDELESVGGFGGAFDIIGKNDSWNMSMFQDLFQADCELLLDYAKHDCSPEARIKTIEYAINNPDKKSILLFKLEKDWGKKYNVRKKDYDETVAYFITLKKFNRKNLDESLILNVHKKTFQTIMIVGKFHQKEIDWMGFK